MLFIAGESALIVGGAGRVLFFELIVFTGVANREVWGVSMPSSFKSDSASYLFVVMTDVRLFDRCSFDDIVFSFFRSVPFLVLGSFGCLCPRRKVPVL